MLAEILDKLLTEDDKRAILESHPRPPDRDAGPTCDQEFLGSGSPPPPHSIKCQASIASRGVGVAQGLANILCEFMVYSATCLVATAWLKDFLAACARCLDFVASGGQRSCLMTAPACMAQPRGVKRARRLDCDLIALVATDAVQSKRFRSAARSARGLKLCPESTAQGMEETTMAKYMQATQRTFANQAHLSLSFNEHLETLGSPSEAWQWRHDEFLCRLGPRPRRANSGPQVCPPDTSNWLLSGSQRPGAGPLGPLKCRAYKDPRTETFRGFRRRC